MRFLTLSLLLSALAYGQPWSNVLSSSRAIDWSKAGLPAVLPSGETTPNPWTPPTRTQCVTAACNTVSSGTVTGATINAALASAPVGTYVLIPPGNFSITDTRITLYLQNGVTLRGSGAQSTTLTFHGTTYFAFNYAAYGGGSCTTWSGPFTPGGSSANLTVSGCSGYAPIAGELLRLAQCDSGISGVGCASGAHFDNGGLFVCAFTASCARDYSGSPYAVQSQLVRITSVTNTGSGAYTLGVTPGPYMPNWGVTINGQYSTPYVEWTQGATGPTVWGVGLEDFTVYTASDSNPNNGQDAPIAMREAYASWVKGVRVVQWEHGAIMASSTKNCLLANNYVFGHLSMTNSYGPTIDYLNGSDNLILNNIVANSPSIIGYGKQQGDVIAYNYGRDAFAFDTNGFMEHGAGSWFELYEGNDVDSDQDDNTNGIHDLNTRFRQFMRGSYPPYSPTHAAGLTLSPFSRFENVIGNSFGTTAAVPGGELNRYMITTNSGYNYVHGFGFSGSMTDSLVVPTAMLWGNYDTATGTIRWQNSEVPTSLSGASVPFQNPAPASHNLPCSFFLESSTTCSPHPNGGTGLNWWKVATAWSTFPTTPTASLSTPYPPIGPDVTGGSINAGTVRDIPAVVAWKNLPIDTTYQQSYSITGSSWTAGVETLTVSGFNSSNVGSYNNANHLMGGFQLSGVNSACLPTSGVSYTGRSDGEIIMTNSAVTTTGSISYALATNPGVACTGTFKFPNVRQFDQRVYQLDPAGSAPAVSLDATSHNFGNQGIGVQSAGFVVTLRNTGNAALSISSITASGDFASSSNCPMSPSTLGMGSSCTITARFTPTQAGARSGSILIGDNAADSPQSISLTGTGVASQAGSIGTGIGAGHVIAQ